MSRSSLLAFATTLMTVERALPCSEVSGRTESVVIASWPSYVVGVEFTKDHDCVAVERCTVQDFEMAGTVLCRVLL